MMQKIKTNVFVLQGADGELLEKPFYDTTMPVMFDSRESAEHWLVNQDQKFKIVEVDVLFKGRGA